MADDESRVASGKPKSDQNNANSSNNSGQTPARVDTELDDLLDSALQDFDKQKVANSENEKPSETSASTASLPTEDALADEFSEQMAAHFEEAMKAFMSQDPNMMEQLQKLSDAAGKADDSAEAQQEFAATLSQTLSGLSQNAEALQQQQLSEQDLNQAFANMGMGEASSADAEGNPDFFPMMQGMMQMLLSKEVLYPSLKEISGKYPKWLEDNKGSVDDTEYDKYTKQHVLMNEICNLYEAEQETDTPEIRSERFDKLMGIMQQMQELGQPPKEIVGEMAPGLEFDENGLPKLPGMSSSCAVM